jgi:phage shock protein PspC (stress-responsive transcriptional regulator)
MSAENAEQAGHTSQSQDSPGDPSPGERAGRQLTRPRSGGMLTGTAAGIAEYFGMDPTILRIVFVALIFMGGAGLPLYLGAWLLIPEQGARQSIAMDLLDSARGLFGAPSEA